MCLNQKGILMKREMISIVKDYEKHQGVIKDEIWHEEDDVIKHVHVILYQ